MWQNQSLPISLSFLNVYQMSEPSKNKPTLNGYWSNYLTRIGKAFQEQTSNPTTFSTNIITGGFEVCDINSRILRNENARASSDCFWRPTNQTSVITLHP